LDNLKELCRVITPDHFLKGRELNKFIASFKVGICLKHMPNWPVSSPCRLSRLLHAKRGIAAEYVPVQTGPSAFVAMAEKDQDFASFCLECVRGPWQLRAEEAYERYRAAMPMKIIMERLLDETVSSMDTSAAEDDGLRSSPTFQRTDPQPKLVESHDGFNFVYYSDRIYAVAEEIGPLDIAVEADTLVERFGSDLVVVARTIEEARGQVSLNSALRPHAGTG
jgi:hypothetical protein